MKQISAKLGDNIKRIRTKKNMSQGGRHRKDFRCPRELYQWLGAGGIRNPSLLTVQKVAKALGVSSKELIE